MKTLATASLLSVLSLLAAAGICFFVADSQSETAARELSEFKTRARAEARKARIFPVSPHGYVVSMVPPTLSAADQAGIDAKELRYKSLAYRRAFAASIFMPAIIAVIFLAGYRWWLSKPVVLKGAGSF